MISITTVGSLHVILNWGELFLEVFFQLKRALGQGRSTIGIKTITEQSTKDPTVTLPRFVFLYNL